VSEAPIDGETAAGLDAAAEGSPEGLARPQSLEELFGGVRGVVDSSLPPVAFIAVNAWRGLDAAIWTAVGVGLLLLLVRLVRREIVRHTFSGFFGILIAVAFAKMSGSAKGYFGPGIALNAVYAAVFIGSVIIRKPLVGALYKSFQKHPPEWFEHPRVRRAYSEVTLLWGAVFLARVVVKSIFYVADKPGWLAVTTLAMGWPLTLLALGATVPWVTRRTADVPVAEPDELVGTPIR
jgi:hypothetical protein